MPIGKCTCSIIGALCLTLSIFVSIYDFMPLPFQQRV